MTPSKLQGAPCRSRFTCARHDGDFFKFAHR